MWSHWGIELKTSFPQHRLKFVFFVLENCHPGFRKFLKKCCHFHIAKYRNPVYNDLQTGSRKNNVGLQEILVTWMEEFMTLITCVCESGNSRRPQAAFWKAPSNRLYHIPVVIVKMKHTFVETAGIVGLDFVSSINVSSCFMCKYYFPGYWEKGLRSTS